MLILYYIIYILLSEQACRLIMMFFNLKFFPSMFIPLYYFQNTANPKMDEWSRFVRTLQELKQQAVEREEESSLGSVSMTSPLR